MGQRWGSKTDDAELIDLCKWIREKLQLEHFGIWRDHFLLIDQRTGSFKVREFVSESDAKSRIIHRPDIILKLLDAEDIVVIEVDGSIHGWKHVKKKTAKRNQHYQDYKIPHIIADKADLKSVNMTVKDLLEIEIPKHLERVFDIDRIRKRREDYMSDLRCRFKRH